MILDSIDFTKCVKHICFKLYLLVKPNGITVLYKLLRRPTCAIPSRKIRLAYKDEFGGNNRVSKKHIQAEGESENKGPKETQNKYRIKIHFIQVGKQSSSFK